MRDVRKQAKMTQADLARAIGVHQVVVSNWETGQASNTDQTHNRHCAAYWLQSWKI